MVEEHAVFGLQDGDLAGTVDEPHASRRLVRCLRRNGLWPATGAFDLRTGAGAEINDTPADDLWVRASVFSAAGHYRQAV